MDYAIIIVVYATLFIGSPLMALIHELGHAYAYIWLTKSPKIDVYVGSYGDKKNNIQFTAGRINFYIKRLFPFVKGIGLCRSHTPETNYRNAVIVFLAGPVFTLFVAAIPVFIIIAYPNSNLLVSIVCYVFLGLASFSLLVNLIPRETNLLQQERLENDGQQILFALKMKRAYPSYIEGVTNFRNKEFEKAIQKFDEVLLTSPAEKKVLRLLIPAQLQTKHFEDAEKNIALLENTTEMSVDDLINKGYLYSATKRHHEAIETYNRALKRERNNVVILNNMGYDLIEQNAHEVAKKALEKAIKLKPEFDVPYCNLGYSNILQGNLQEGKVLIDKSIKLNPTNADAFKYLGIYYSKLGERDQAQLNFDKALELDSNIDLGEYNRGK